MKNLQKKLGRSIQSIVLPAFIDGLLVMTRGIRKIYEFSVKLSNID